jgi:hypothetical protein
LFEKSFPQLQDPLTKPYEQKNACKNVETREFLKDHGGDEVLELSNRWEKLV